MGFNIETIFDVVYDQESGFMTKEAIQMADKEIKEKLQDVYNIVRSKFDRVHTIYLINLVLEEVELKSERERKCGECRNDHSN